MVASELDGFVTHLGYFAQDSREVFGRVIAQGIELKADGQAHKQQGFYLEDASNELFGG